MRRHSTLSEKPHCSVNQKLLNESYPKKKWPCKRKDEEWHVENKLGQRGKKFEINGMAASVLPVANVYNDYQVKYHSVSGGSTLSQSMKYAEAWLYGSLNIKPTSLRSRSTFFNVHRNIDECLVNGDDKQKYDQMNSNSNPNVDKRMLQRRRSESSRTIIDDKKRNTCEKCVASFTKESPIATIRAYNTASRYETCPSYRHTKDYDEDHDKKESIDPYDIVRRSRLSGLKDSTIQMRTKSFSVKKNQQVTQLLSPSTVNERSALSCINDKDISKANDGAVCRRSILDCNINPYDLVKQTAPASPFEHNDLDKEAHLLTSDDDIGSTSDNKTMTNTKKKNKLTLRYKFKTKIRAQYFKNVLTKDVTPCEVTTAPTIPNSVINGISIAGQKIRVFNSTDTQDSLKNKEDWIKDTTMVDDEQCSTFIRAEVSDNSSVDGDSNEDKNDKYILSHQCRPKRPPRRKTRSISSTTNDGKDDTEIQKNDKHMDTVTIITSTTKRPDIRSILKKPLYISHLHTTQTHDTFELNKRSLSSVQIDKGTVDLNVVNVSVTSSITTTASVPTGIYVDAISSSALATINSSAAITTANISNSADTVAGSVVVNKNFYSTMTFDCNKKANKKVKKQVQFKGMQDQIIEDESGSKSIMDIRRHVRQRPIAEETSYTSYDIVDVDHTLTTTTPQQSQFSDGTRQTLSTEKQQSSPSLLHYHDERDNEKGNRKLNVNNRSIDVKCGDGVTSLPIAKQIVVNESSSCYQIVSSSMNATAIPPTPTSTFVSFDSVVRSNAFTRFSQAGDNDEIRNIEPISRLHRTLSDCVSSKPLVINLKCGPFNDTMRLHIRANQQNDATNKLFYGRQVAIAHDNVINVGKSMLSRPTKPPPSPPFVSIAPVDSATTTASTKPYLPPRQYFPFNKSENLVVNKICSVNIPVNDAKSNSECNFSFDSVTGNKVSKKISDEDGDVDVKIPSLTETFLQNRTCIMDKDRNSYSGSVVKIDVTSESLSQLQSTPRKPNLENRTIVTISPSNEISTLPRILVNEEGNTSWNERTSIMINSDESSTITTYPHVYQNTNIQNVNNYKCNSIVSINVGEFDKLMFRNRESNVDLSHSSSDLFICQQNESRSLETVKCSFDNENNENNNNDDNSEDRKSTTLSFEDSLSTASDSNCSNNSSGSNSSFEQEYKRENENNYDNGFSLHYMSCKINEKFVEEHSDSTNTTICENGYNLTDEPIYEEIEETSPTLRRSSTPPPPPLPLKPPPDKVDDIGIIIPPRSIFEGASKYDILKYLACAKERCKIPEEPEFVIDESTYTADADCDSDQNAPHSRNVSSDLSSRVSHLSNVSDSSDELTCFLTCSNGTNSSDKTFRNCADIERNDSGVGSETSKCSRSKWQHIQANSLQEDQQHTCEDCDQEVEPQTSDSGLIFAPLVCRKCSKKRIERREIITEIVETEEKYGRDLHIILEEFYKPMLVAGLLTPEQLSSIFLNVEELLEHNTTLAEKLRDGYEIAVEQGDEDLLTFNIGKIFLDTAPMLHAFESYCTRQGNAALLLAHLEKEKELLKIFLRVSQMENTVLRRMNLNSFLMVPVQRVTKYPLLLARLYKVTPEHHTIQRELLKEAQHNIELHLEHINSLTKDIGSTKIWRRISMMNGRRVSGDADDIVNIKLQKMAVEVLEWGHDEVRFAMEGRLLYTQPTDYNWKRTGRTIKLVPVNALLVTLGKPMENYNPDCEDLLMFPQKNGIREASLLLMKEKGGKYSLVRNPLFLDHCIIYCDDNFEEYFEVQEIPTKDTYIFKGEDDERTKRWCKQLQYHSQGLGCWRKRRNALANIMINGMQIRS